MMKKIVGAYVAARLLKKAMKVKALRKMFH